MGQAAAGLDAAHRAGVVHRDIKPGDLHLTADGLPKVVDFGIARLAGEQAGRLTAVGTVVGTAAYLSPEQILGRGGDAAADLYALGCVCYELLCGRPPFVGVPTELIYQHLNQPPVPPRRLRPDVPATWRRWCWRCWPRSPPPALRAPPRYGRRSAHRARSVRRAARPCSTCRASAHGRPTVRGAAGLVRASTRRSSPPRPCLRALWCWRS
jgi:serine/threonine-protein kinase